jgi:hypothetical protein
VVVPALGAPVEPSTAMAKVVPTRPASPVEAIIVSSGDETKAGEAVPGVVSPIVSDLLRAIPDTLEVVPSSDACRAEEARPSDPTRKVLGGGLLGDEIDIVPPLSGGSGDLVHATSDPSLWGGMTLVWMSTEGGPYIILDDLEERELWAEMRAVTQVRVLILFVLGILRPFTM